jgi:putative ABC transport system substrate-binding protein
MKRREFITLLGGAAAWPFAARAQPPAMPVIGFLRNTLIGQNVESAFRQGLGETGFVEGRNVAIEYRWAENRYDRLPVLVAELVERRVAVIVAIGPFPLAAAAKAAGSTIPVVFGISEDPVKFGLVASLDRPGGNLTGVTVLNAETAQKRLELMHELIPAARDIALLINPTNPATEYQLKDLQSASRALGVKLHVFQASAEHEFDTAFATLTRLRPGGLVVVTDGLFVARSEQLAALALRNAIPAVFQYREFTAAGGLMSYGGSNTEEYRLAGAYTGRILKGEKPSNLPVQRTTKVELILNLKTAKALGLTFPLSLLGRADEVIE